MHRPSLRWRAASPGTAPVSGSAQAVHLPQQIGKSAFTLQIFDQLGSIWQRHTYGTNKERPAALAPVNLPVITASPVKRLGHPDHRRFPPQGLKEVSAQSLSVVFKENIAIYQEQVDLLFDPSIYLEDTGQLPPVEFAGDIKSNGFNLHAVPGKDPFIGLNFEYQAAGAGMLPVIVDIEAGDL